MLKKITVVLLFLGWAIFIDCYSSSAQIGYNLDTFIVHSQKIGRYPDSFTERQFIYLFSIFKVYKFGCVSKLKISEKELDQNKVAVLREKYSTAQFYWNLYLDTLKGYLKEYPTKQGFINRSKLFAAALEALRDYLYYYKKHFSHLYMDNLLYKKRMIRTLTDYYNKGYKLFDYYENNGKVETKESYIPHIDILYWDTWENILKVAPK